MDCEKLRDLLEQAPDAIIFADCEGVIHLWNGKATEVFGFTACEAKNHTLDMIIPPGLRNEYWRGFRQATGTGRGQSRERRLTTQALRKDGRPLYVDLCFSVAHDAAGATTGAIVIVRDVTGRFLAEDSALDFERHLRVDHAT